MTEELGTRAAGLLIGQAWDAYQRGRYQEVLAAAGRAVHAAGQLDDSVLLVRALQVQASALQMTGDNAAALVRYTKIMALAEDPATGSRLDDPDAAKAVGDAYWSWAEAARFAGGIAVRDLFRVLDAADRWLAATGHRDWRASILLQRALVHNDLGETEAAGSAGEEDLAATTADARAPAGGGPRGQDPAPGRPRLLAEPLPFPARVHPPGCRAGRRGRAALPGD